MELFSNNYGISVGTVHSLPRKNAGQPVSTVYGFSKNSLTLSLPVSFVYK